MPEKFTDTLSYALSVALAAAVLAFAAWKVVTLYGLENPPPDMGLNFPSPKRRVIVDGLAAADPITTQSVSPAPAATPRGGAEGPAGSYELVAVVDGVAFVEVALARSKTLVPVTVGTVLPGGLRIDAIEKRDGRWVLVAGNTRLEQAAVPAQ